VCCEELLVVVVLLCCLLLVVVEKAANAQQQDFLDVQPVSEVLCVKRTKKALFLVLSHFR